MRERSLFASVGRPESLRILRHMAIALLAAYGVGRVISLASKIRWLLIVGFLVASVVWIRRGAT
jgi:hypothetical protein